MHPSTYINFQRLLEEEGRLVGGGREESEGANSWEALVSDIISYGVGACSVEGAC